MLCKFSYITIGVLYHPPRDNNWLMTQHLSHCIDAITQKHLSAGVFTTGDFNTLKNSSVKSSFSLKQIVTKATRGKNILDKVLTNMSSLSMALPSFFHLLVNLITRLCYVNQLLSMLHWVAHHKSASHVSVATMRKLSLLMLF